MVLINGIMLIKSFVTLEKDQFEVKLKQEASRPDSSAV